jgi:hypothetical protein
MVRSSEPSGSTQLPALQERVRITVDPTARVRQYGALHLEDLMKKFAIGCLIALGLLVVVGGIGLYFAYDRLFRPGMEMAQTVTELSTLGELEKQVRNTAAFEAPAEGELTQAMVDRFVDVQQRVQAALGPRLAELKAKQEQLDKTLSGEKREATLREIAAALKDLAAIVLQAKRAQVEALNAAGFSVREYEWVREQVYAAVGIPAVGFDMQKVAAEAQAGRIERITERERGTVGDVPARNKTLVAPHEAQLKEWAPLAFFGL